MSYHNNSKKTHPELSKLAGDIAAHLPDYVHESDSADYRPRAILRHKTKPIWFCIAYDWNGKGQRLSIQSEHPPRWKSHGFQCPHGYTITVSKHRAPGALAADITRRFLKDYAPEYVKNYQTAHANERAAQATKFEREQIRQTFGGEWKKHTHSQYGDDEWTEQTTGLKIRYTYRDRPTFTIETPQGEPAKIMALALRYAIETINTQPKTA